MKLIKGVFVFLLYFVCLLAIAQEHPPINSYTPNDYGAENQNWSISQSVDKYIYVANNQGLLEYNGAKWTLYPSPNQTIIRSVNAFKETIYTGSYKEFGYWKRNELGILIYHSLSKELKITFLEDEEFWNIITLDDWVLFQSLKRIYIYNKKDHSYSVINSETTIYKMFKINESIYFQKVKDGVYEIKNGASKLVSNNSVLRENLLVNIFNHNGNILFQTEDNGFYIFNKTELTKWNISANETISKHRIYNSKQLKDKSFLLGTISNGIIHLTPKGDINYQINQTSGLSNNTVLSVFEDIDNNIWLGLENGIDCINIKSPFSIYNDEAGNIGAVNASALFKGYLYIGTNQGLFYKKEGIDNTFKFIEGTQGAVWCLKVLKDTLFCGHNSGTFVINEGKAKLAIDVLGTWNIRTIDNSDNLLLQGNYSGLYVLENKEGLWQLRNKIEGFDVSSRYFEMLSQTEVFVSHEYKGVFKIKLNDALTKVNQIVKETSVDKGLKTSLTKYQGDILYAHQKGIFKFNKENQVFKKDSILSRLFKEEEYTSGKLVNDTANNRLWSFSLHGLNYLAPRKLSNIPKIKRISFPSYVRNDVSGYENITHISDNKYLYGTSLGYVIIDLNKLYDKTFEVNINQISNSTYKNTDRSNYVDKTKKGQFKNKENNIEFSFSVPEYSKYLITEYQYKLDGIYNEWSQWSTKSSELFENLPYGDYTFYVRARLGNEISTNTERYGFNIEAPWYLKKVMIAFYVAFFLLFSLLMHNIYKRYYKKQREKLLLKNKRELELKELENKEQLMRLNNENLKQDIENKNRELAISTMSLIKKNEFLNSIKKELGDVTKNNKSLKHVIKIIDRNLNNTDDWHVFEEAFNNADKDFLKKVKTLHPNLTSNDLRLCAYLRLNLSSKEIAPLLNISARSVEVKRYRLRKKMDLQHESSLTDYILEI
ncbi:helix-turn-helix and ligand-binding sensor domain-containing protein [Snuella sedimenti]|uniref:LuxR family transcriptional regulator n=1 Tax=Snuella sedimenti TaxID=2798802 RepID=A0A8J7J2A3_9FLAO|nr:LuxR C-terminal-related transcriptional regulator [Snuella sedimenti]MBJ6368437.1 LuxR family transcriptional regulator [Snuella sedimenti]